MPSLKKYAPHGLASGLTPEAALDAVRAGELVIPPFGGAMAQLPAHLDLMAFTVFVDDFYRYEESGTAVGGWKKSDIGNGLSAEPLIGPFSLNGDLDFTTADTAQGDGASVQWDGQGGHNLATTRPYWFTARINLFIIANSHARVGLGATTTNPFSADPNGAFFVIGESTNGQLGVITKNAAGTTEVADTGYSLSSNTWTELSWRYDGTDLKYYKDRTLIHTETSNIPTGLSLDVFFGLITRGDTVTSTFAIDFVQVVSLR